MKAKLTLITVKRSNIYNSGHMYPVGPGDMLKYNVCRDDKVVESFSDRETANEFAKALL